MYRTQYSLEVHITGVDDSTQLEDSAALHQIKSCQNIDVPGLIIPYHAVEYVVVTPTRTETEDPVDDNCIVDGGDEPAETGTLKIVNVYSDVDDVYVAISSPLDGTYGDLTFSTTPPGGSALPEGYHALAMIPLLVGGGSVTATGIPVGTQALVDGPDPYTVPCTVYYGVDETGELSVENTNAAPVNAFVYLSIFLNGTFGDLTFSTTPPPGVTLPDGYHSVATCTIPAASTVTATGIPHGTTACANTSDAETYDFGEVPCLIQV